MSVGGMKEIFINQAKQMICQAVVWRMTKRMSTPTIRSAVPDLLMIYTFYEKDDNVRLNGKFEPRFYKTDGVFIESQCEELVDWMQFNIFLENARLMITTT